MEVKIDETWKSKLSDEFEKEYFIKLAEFVKEEYQNQYCLSSRKSDF